MSPSNTATVVPRPDECDRADDASDHDENRFHRWSVDLLGALERRQ